MLRELCAWLCTPCSGAARRLGLAYESVAIAGRRRRCAAAWAPHLARCKELMVRAAAACPGTGRVVVLGSGRLLDIPLEALAARFREVVLADVVHPLAVRWQVRRHPNVGLLDWDCTGLHRELARICKAGRNAALPRAPRPELPGPRPDLVISANLLSQLALRPAAALRRALPDPDEAALAELARGLVQAHLAWLPQAADRACLITDVRRLVLDQAGVREQRDLLAGVDPGLAGETWEWDLAPRPEAYPDADVRHLVLGVEDLGRCAASRAGSGPAGP